MGKKFLKWTIRVIASIVLLASIFYAIVYFNTNSRMNKKYDFEDEITDIAMDSITLAEGAHLAKIRGCEDCHGTNLGGKLMIDDAIFGTI
ncbi:MAG: cytochrome c, partial [Chitinophagaceae bacterium]